MRFEIEWDDVEWICLAQDRDRWRALVSKVMKVDPRTGLDTREEETNVMLPRIGRNLLS
jgi:hypothetical protein